MSEQGVASNSTSIVRNGVDSHQHFWKFDAVRDSWITDDMSAIKTNFLPPDLQPILRENNFEGCIAVQADQSEKENDFLLQLAKENTFIKGIVGWVDLQANNIHDRLTYYKSFNLIKGFRHVLQGEQDRALMLKPGFMEGIAALQQYGFTYDILVYADQLKYVSELVACFPDQKFVLDHIGKPLIKEGSIDEWVRDIAAIAHYENVYCKLSGMVTEANWKEWKKEDFSPYLDIVVDAFGPTNIMFGSDWPVCLVAASYERMLEIITDYFSSFTADEQDRVFRQNAIEFYNLH